MIYLRQREKLEDSDDDEGPQDEDAWLIEDLKVLAHLYSSLKDKEELISLIFEVPTHFPFLQAISPLHVRGSLLIS